ncbi:MAG: DMP19 family protein [Proteobacteria bacterium]|nr:DMP19 family protein [Pseudomonadota bacterium]
MKKEEVKKRVDELEMEINNGGFDQFFFNSAGDNTDKIITALEMIGASHTAQIVQKALKKFPDGKTPTDRVTRQKILETISPDSDAFEEEDDMFFEYVDDLEELVENYLNIS